MKLLSKRSLVIIVCLVVVISASLLFNGFFGGTKDTHPPCDKLPTVEESAQALVSNKDYAENIMALGDQIEVKVGTPCGDDQDRGLIKVIYGTKAERSKIIELISSRDGFGVPIHLEKR